MDTVIFLGAGASMDAGYPSTDRLLETIGEDIHAADLSTKQAWERFCKWKGGATGILKVILDSANPELVLTIPDLLAATLKSTDENRFRKLVEAIEIGENVSESEIDALYNYPAREELKEGLGAIDAFNRVASYFLRRRHYQDGKPENGERREYLRRALGLLDKQATVITTNWDTLVERTLLEAGRWSPSDGYGFRVSLMGDVPLRWSISSSVKVLKLHGSLGWRRTKNGIFLKRAGYLQHLPFSSNDVSDESEIRSEDDNEALLVFPSYLKQLKGSVLQSIWDQAGRALNQAKTVIFVGYSLPPADVAVRTLINPLRRCLDQQKVRIRVIDPDRAVLDRWKAFLGENICDIPMRAKDYFLSNA